MNAWLLHTASRLKHQTPGKPASLSLEMIPNQLRVSSPVSRQEEEMMDGRTGSEQDRDRATSGQGQGLKSEPCFQTDSLLPSPSASLISQLLSYPMVCRSLDPTILFPSSQAAALPQDYEHGASPGEGAQALAFPRSHDPPPMPCAVDRDQLSDQHLQDQLSDQHLRAKRARVESIIQGMSIPPTPQAFGSSLEAAFGHERERGCKVPRESKRKPRQGAEKVHPRLGNPGDRPDKDRATATSDLRKAPLWRSVLEVRGQEEDEDRGDTGGLPSAARVLSQALKHELAGVTSRVVDSVLKTVWPKAASHLLQQHRSLPVPGPDARREYFAAGKCRKPLAKPSPMNTPVSLGSTQAEALSGASGKSLGSHAGSFSSKGVRKPSQVPSMGYSLGSAAPVQDSQLLSQLLGYGQHGFWGSSSRGSPSAPERGPLEPLDLHWGTVKLRSSVMRQQQQHPLPLSPAATESLMQEALTPGHLKKAKLMFFFTRYPSSTLLKTYFLDVQFSRCITSQLIKWFSNFREFYYIQVEKFARQALLEGVVDASTLRVSRDSELFRALNMHYNKGNDFEVPGRLLEVASLTLREFFSAVRAGKDADPSWKKPIYKIISKLDSDIPEGFKAAGCSQELLRS
ncbi:PREDICTED: prospero homeobox protein 2 [Pygoscelis adeliae]|uniref:prospero homeobox protein 2 n=1 Tax=Pygoscelis adeliae TaxID=9238 RepID=UPI0004F4F47A|nr:PREDICTED: prospero homeobox protein 2 [Pygoscelis adeliae]